MFHSAVKQLTEPSSFLGVIDSLFDTSSIPSGAGSLVTSIMNEALNEMKIMSAVLELEEAINSALSNTACRYDTVVWLGDFYIRPSSYRAYNALRAYGTSITQRLSADTKEVLTLDFAMRVLYPTRQVKRLTPYPHAPSFAGYSRHSRHFSFF